MLHLVTILPDRAFTKVQIKKPTSDAQGCQVQPGSVVPLEMSDFDGTRRPRAFGYEAKGVKKHVHNAGDDHRTKEDRRDNAAALPP